MYILQWNSYVISILEVEDETPTSMVKGVLYR